MPGIPTFGTTKESGAELRCLPVLPRVDVLTDPEVANK